MLLSTLCIVSTMVAQVSRYVWCVVCWYSSTFAISQMNPLWSNGVKTLIINTFVVCRSLYPLLLVPLPNWFTFAIALGRRVLNSSFNTGQPQAIREQISKAQETPTILQAGRHRTYHWTFESSSSFRPQLLQRCGRRRCKHTDGCSCLQFQKSYESSFVAAQNNKREAGEEWLFTYQSCLRDD